VARRLVCDLVCGSQAVKMILFQAPAGFGKTTAMAQCRSRLSEMGVATGWLALDASDNDASRFMGSLGSAVHAITDEEPPAVETSHPGAGRWLGDVALEIVDRLSRHPSPFALFLDDFEALQDPGALAVVREILGHLPRRGQLVIGSRSLPNLTLSRLRAREELLEIGPRELRFSMEETAEFLSRRRPTPLHGDDVSLLHRKTEGWPAALSLASVALERHEAPGEFIARFSGSNAAVAEYIAEDVLARHPGEVRAFLLRTSILRELTPSICEALVPGVDAASLLDQIERAALFLTPIAGADRTYRYHSLFAGFLRAQAARELPGELPSLHRAAASWYEARQRPVPAVDHAIEARDFDHALELISGAAESLLARGRMRLLSRWFRSLPREVLSTRPLLQVIEAWALAFTRGPGEAMALLQRSGCEASDDPVASSYVLSLRPALLTFMDRYEAAHEAGRDGLRRLSPDAHFARMSIAAYMADICSVLGRNDEARSHLETARFAQSRVESTLNVMCSESAEGMIDLREGRLRLATARFRMAVNATHVESFGYTSGNAWAGVLYAIAVYETNDLDQAARLLSVYAPLARDVGLPDHMILGYGALSRIAFCRGEVDDAFRVLTELEYLGHRRQLQRVVLSAKLERARVLLLQGHADTARRELASADDPALWERIGPACYIANDLEYLALGRERWEVLAGNARSAIPRLEKAIEASAAEGRGRRALKLRLLRAMALERCGEERQALAAGEDVLRAASSEGFQRLVLDEGPTAAAVVRRVERALLDRDSHRVDPTFREYLQRLREAFGPVAAELEEVAAEKNAMLLEPLTPKEISVLQLLAEGYSNSAMAAKLFVADSTIRTHLRNINGKLEARSRTHAVAVARRKGIIP
jgi:LuxR family maltose regulon positive regulatory protein